MKLEQIQEWLAKNTSMDATANNYFVGILSSLMNRNIEVNDMRLGEEGYDDDFIVALLRNPETNLTMVCGFDGFSDAVGYTNAFENFFEARLYPQDPTLSAELVQAHILDYLEGNEYNACYENGKEEQFECVIEALKTHLNPFSKEFKRSDNLKIEAELTGQVNLVFNENDQVLSMHKLNDHAVFLLTYIADRIYKNDLLTVHSYSNNQQRDKCHQLMG